MSAYSRTKRPPGYGTGTKTANTNTRTDRHVAHCVRHACTWQPHNDFTTSRAHMTSLDARLCTRTNSPCRTWLSSRPALKKRNAKKKCSQYQTSRINKRYTAMKTLEPWKTQTDLEKLYLVIHNHGLHRIPTTLQDPDGKARHQPMADHTNHNIVTGLNQQ